MLFNQNNLISIHFIKNEKFYILNIIVYNGATI